MNITMKKQNETTKVNVLLRLCPFFSSKDVPEIKMNVTKKSREDYPSLILVASTHSHISTQLPYNSSG